MNQIEKIIESIENSYEVLPETPPQLKPIFTLKELGFLNEVTTKNARNRVYADLQEKLDDDSCFKVLAAINLGFLYMAENKDYRNRQCPLE